MYNIIKHSDGSLVAIVEKPNYIRRHKNGCNVLCGAREAQGIACGGKAYNLIGREPISEEYETVVAVERDGGAMLQEQQTLNSIAFVTMAEAGTIDDVTAGEHMNEFAGWVSGAEYREGSIRRHGDKLYRCVSAHTSQDDSSPGLDTTHWTQIADPRAKWQDWSAPVGAHDAYEKGDQVVYGGKHWRSLATDNCWTPGVGANQWEEVPEIAVLNEVE